MQYTALIILLAVIQYMFFMAMVGKARWQYGISAPACTGNEQFERMFRVHQNSLEQLIIFIPAQFAFGWYVSPLWGAVIGVVYITGRFVYARGYIREPAKRGPGMMMSFISSSVLVLGALSGILIQLLSA